MHAVSSEGEKSVFVYSSPSSHSGKKKNMKKMRRSVKKKNLSSVRLTNINSAFSVFTVDSYHVIWMSQALLK